MYIYIHTAFDEESEFELENLQKQSENLPKVENQNLKQFSNKSPKIHLMVFFSEKKKSLRVARLQSHRDKQGSPATVLAHQAQSKNRPPFKGL